MSGDEQPTGISGAGENQADESNILSGNSANGAAVIERQPRFSRVTPEEAASLPYDELRRRMTAEHRMAEDGTLPDDAGVRQANSDDADANLESAAEEASTGASESQQQASQPTTQRGGGSSQPDGNQSSRLAELEAELARVRQERESEAASQRQQQLLMQHQQVEANIARLPEAQRAAARAEYANRLHQDQLNQYYGFLQQREAAVAGEELRQTKNYMVTSLPSLAEFVANSNGIKPEFLASYVQSDDVKATIQRVTDNASLETAMHTISNTLNYMAAQEAARLQAAREARRERDANRVQRDVPQGVQSQTAGGGIDEVARINNMSREEFFAWKRQQFAAQRASA